MRQKCDWRRTPIHAEQSMEKATENSSFMYTHGFSQQSYMPWILYSAATRKWVHFHLYLYIDGKASLDWIFAGERVFRN